MSRESGYSPSEPLCGTCDVVVLSCWDGSILLLLLMWLVEIVYTMRLVSSVRLAIKSSS